MIIIFLQTTMILGSLCPHQSVGFLIFNFSIYFLFFIWLSKNLETLRFFCRSFPQNCLPLTQVCLSSCHNNRWCRASFSIHSLSADIRKDVNLRTEFADNFGEEWGNLDQNDDPFGCICIHSKMYPKYWENP